MRAVVLAVTLLALGPASASARQRGCDIPRSHVVAKSSRVVVVRHARDYFACMRPGGTRRSLKTDGSETVTGYFRLAGRFVAYEREDGCYEPCRRIVSLDVGSSRPLVSYAAYGEPSLRQMVVNTRGRVAWVRDGQVRELHRMDSDGEETVDTGSGIAPTSLAITRDQVTWRKEGEPKSAPLDSHPPCAARNTSTLERTPEVRVFWKALPPTRDDTFGTIYGCAVADGRVTRMGSAVLDTFEYYGAGYMEVAGHFATIDEGFSGRSGSNVDLSVFNLKTGRRVHRWASRDGDYNLQAVVLSPKGAVAWMYWGGPYGGSTLKYAVAKSDATGEAVELASSDTSNEADRETLRLDGDTVSWTLGGAPGSAELR